MQKGTKQIGRSAKEIHFRIKINVSGPCVCLKTNRWSKSG